MTEQIKDSYQPLTNLESVQNKLTLIAKKSRITNRDVFEAIFDKLESDQNNPRFAELTEEERKVSPGSMASNTTLGSNVWLEMDRSRIRSYEFDPATKKLMRVSLGQEVKRACIENLLDSLKENRVIHLIDS